MNECDLLKWAAGAPVALPRFEGVPDDRLLALLGIDEGWLVSLLQQHRLEHRFLLRALRERPAWCGRRLLAHIGGHCEAIERHRERQLRRVGEAARVLASSGCPLIAVKGFSTHALTGERRHLRFSKDVDLLCDDPTRLGDTLLRLGYTGIRLDHLDAHEFASMRRAETEIEIHRYFPVPAYPSGVAGADLSPERHPGLWAQSFPNIPVQRLRYADVLAHSAPGPAPEMRELMLPSPAMSVLILCAHEFRNLIKGLFRYSLMTRLGVLAEIRDLAAHPRFDVPAFRALVAAFGGHDAVQSVGHLIQAYWGDDPLAPALAADVPPRWSERLRSGLTATVQRIVAQREEAGDPRLPQSLVGDWWCGNWAALLSAEELLLPPELSTMMARLRTSTLVARRAGAMAGAAGAGIERVIIQRQDGEDLPFQLRATYDEQRLRLHLRLAQRFEAGRYYHLLVHGEEYAKLAYWLDVGVDGRLLKEWAQAGEGEAEIAATGEEIHVAIAFPWRALPRGWRRERSGHLLLQLMKCRIREAPHAVVVNDPVIALTVPLHVVAE